MELVGKSISLLLNFIITPRICVSGGEISGNNYICREVRVESSEVLSWDMEFPDEQEIFGWLPRLQWWVERIWNVPLMSRIGVEEREEGPWFNLSLTDVGYN